MSEYEPNDNKSRVEQTESAQCSLEELQQDINQLKFQLKQKQNIKQLRTGEKEVDDLDTIPFYNPRDWESREQYERIIGGVPGTEGYKGD